jgi:hypothetical protein
VNRTADGRSAAPAASFHSVFRFPLRMDLRLRWAVGC